MTRRTIALGIALLVVALLMLGVTWLVLRALPSRPAVQAVTPADASPTSAQPADPALPTVRYPDGTVVRLAGIRFLYDDPPRWWGADGSDVNHGEYDFPYLKSLGGFEYGPRRAIEFRVSADADGARQKSYSLRTGAKQQGGASHYQWDGEYGVMFSAVQSIDSAITETELEFAVAGGPWQDFDVVAPADAAARSAEAEPFRTPAPQRNGPSTQPATPGEVESPYRIYSVSEVDGMVYVEYTAPRTWPEVKEMTWQAVVRDKAGRTRYRHRVRHIDGRMTFVYDLPLAEVEAAVYQVRPWVWQSLGTVRLSPTSQPHAVVERAEQEEDTLP